MLSPHQQFLLEILKYKEIHLQFENITLFSDQKYLQSNSVITKSVGPAKSVRYYLDSI